jgi:type II secretory pathway pseudopilin PulG
MQSGEAPRQPMLCLSRAPAYSRTANGFTYIALLIAIAIFGVGLAAIGQIASTTARLQREAQLKWIGTQFVDAIGSYYYASTGPARSYPQTLQDLLQDQRSGNIKRHLRQVYLDPFTNKSDWLLVPAPGAGFRGVAAPKNADARNWEFEFTPTF